MFARAFTLVHTAASIALVSVSLRTGACSCEHACGFWFLLRRRQLQWWIRPEYRARARLRACLCASDPMHALIALTCVLTARRSCTDSKQDALEAANYILGLLELDQHQEHAKMVS